MVERMSIRGTGQRVWKEWDESGGDDRGSPAGARSGVGPEGLGTGLYH
jgi:hypothetical protein